MISRMTAKVSLDFQLITSRLQSAEIPPVDCVVGIATGGTVPASLAAFHLGKPLVMLGINYRAPDNSPRYATPKVIHSAEIPSPVKHILLVDDVSVSGKTVAVAKAQLPDVQITTLVMKGSADIVLFPEVSSCVIWPWKIEPNLQPVAR